MINFVFLSRSTFRILYPFSRRKSSDWIYSNKAEEMSHARKGQIFIGSHTGSDTYDCTLRMHQALTLSHIVLSSTPKGSIALLTSLGKKQRSIKKMQDEQTKAVQAININAQIVSYNQQQQKKKDFENVLQHSKHLEMAIELQKINKSNNDRDNVLLKKHQQQLNKFIESSNMKDKLQKFKNENGFPQTVDLQANINKIQQLRNGGISIFCMLDEFKPSESKILFQYLQQKQLPYQVLPSKNSIINLLASSGFPADRFGIEYFPSSASAALAKRRPMKMSVGMIIRKKQLLNTVQDIRNIYGGEHMVYIECEQGKLIFRGKCIDFDNNSIGMIKTQFIRIAIAPYISTFNQQLKQQRDKVSKLYGEAMSESTHDVRMEFINVEIQQLLKRKETRKVPINAMMQQLIARYGRQKAQLISGDVLGLNRKQVSILSKRAQQSIVSDHIGLAQHIKKK